MKEEIPTITSSQQEEILTLTIPLTSVGSAGLGITVKGKHTEQNNEDNGIFVKSVLKGGAAAKVQKFDCFFLFYFTNQGKILFRIDQDKDT